MLHAVTNVCHLTLQGCLSRLIEGDPELDPVPELCEAQPGVLLKPVRHLTAHPAALVLQGLGQVPVVQSHRGRDTSRQEGGDQVVVVIYPRLILLPNKFRKHTTPSNRISEI